MDMKCVKLVTSFVNTLEKVSLRLTVVNLLELVVMVSFTPLMFLET